MCCALGAPLLPSLFHTYAYCGLFPGGRWPRAGHSLPCPRTPCYVPLVGVRLLVPLGCSFFSPCVICPPLLCPLGHQLATSPWSAPPGPAQRLGWLSGSVSRVLDAPVEVTGDTASSFPLVPGGPSCSPLRRHCSSVLSSYLPDSLPSAGHRALPLLFSLSFLHVPLALRPPLSPVWPRLHLHLRDLWFLPDQRRVHPLGDRITHVVRPRLQLCLSARHALLQMLHHTSQQPVGHGLWRHCMLLECPR